MRPRSPAVLLLAALILLAFAPLALCQPPLPPPSAPQEPYPATPEAVVQKYVDLTQGTPLGRGGMDHSADYLLSAKSQGADNSRELAQVLFIAALMPTMQAHQAAATDNTATVEAIPTPRHVDYQLVLEDGKWKIDVAATLKTLGWLLPPTMNPDVPEGAQGSVSNLKQIGLGLAMYATDYNNKLPAADRWMDLLKPYIKNEQVFHAPSAPEGAYGYAFNPRLSEMQLNDIWNRANVVEAIETPWSWRNAVGGAAALPPAPLYAPYLTAVLYADGHVALVKPGQPLIWDPHDPRLRTMPWVMGMGAAKGMPKPTKPAAPPGAPSGPPPPPPGP